MPMMSAIAEWARQYPKTPDAWRLAGPRSAEVTRAGRGSGDAADVRSEDPRAVPGRPEPFGAHGGLSRILVALVRQPYESPRDRARARASADRLIETIRVLSSF